MNRTAQAGLAQGKYRGPYAGDRGLDVGTKPLMPQLPLRPGL